MNDKEVMLLAVREAEKRGYLGHLRMLPMVIGLNDYQLNKLLEEIFYSHANEILYSPDFINKFFPKGEVDEKLNVLKDGQYHLQRLVNENAIEYIKNYLPKE